MNSRNLLSIALFIMLLGSSLLYLNLSHYIDAESSNEAPITLIIQRGYSVKKIGKELAERNLIAQPKIFCLVHKLFFKATPLQAGEYEIPPHASIRDIINLMHEGKVIVHKLTLPEGITNKEIVDSILNEPMLVGSVTKEFHEGDFLADTYYYTYGESKMMLLNRIYNKSQTIINELWEKRANNLPLANKNEAVALASIIEKETGIASERPRIAGVFINRLRKKMRLQADPTVIYAVTKGEYLFTRSITRADLKIDSPYNTYLYIGLPPTAIASPGIAAIEAALNPLETTELYFVVNGNGGHNFSSNLAEHNNHVSNYRNAK